MANTRPIPNYNNHIPQEIMTLDSVEASIGKRKFFDGVSTRETADQVMFHYPYTAVTPAMAASWEGKGSGYAIAYVNTEKQFFDGAKTYKLNIPADPPAANFWAVTVYDPEQTDVSHRQQPGMIDRVD